MLSRSRLLILGFALLCSSQARSDDFAAPDISATPAETASAQPPRPRVFGRLVTSSAKTGEGIAGLTWLAYDYEVRTRKVDDREMAYIELRGRISDDGRVLIQNGKQIHTGKGSELGSFTIQVPIEGKLTSVPLHAVDSDGVMEKADVVIAVSDFEKLGQEPEVRSSRKRHSIAPSVGLSFLTYTQTGSADISAKGITAKVAFQYLLAPPRWDFGMVGFATAVPFGSDMPGVNMRFFGLNGRVGYNLGFIPEPWKVVMMGGFYYTSMTATNLKQGFQGLMGPQVFPVLRRTLSNGDVLSTYLKLAAVGNSGAGLSLTNRELAGGFGLSHLLSTGNVVTLGLDGANLSLTHDETTISTTSLSFGIGVSF